MVYRINPTFPTYEAAKNFYKLQPELMVILISELPGSYDKVKIGYNLVYYSGFGRKTKLGHPSGNQQYESQVPFFKKVSIQRYFPVFNVMENKSVDYIGSYMYCGYKKKLTREGFSYYEIGLKRIGRTL